MSRPEHQPESRSSRSYRCSFCRERLQPEPLEGWDYLRLLLFLRRHTCPHCFEIYHRPPLWFGRLPLIRLVLTRASDSDTGGLPQRADVADTAQYRVPGPLGVQN